MRVTDSDTCTSPPSVGWGRAWTFFLQPFTVGGNSPYLSEVFLSIFSFHINKLFQNMQLTSSLTHSYIACKATNSLKKRLTNSRYVRKVFKQISCRGFFN